jgi:glycerophosphoryl diester phosphodiesterase
MLTGALLSAALLVAPAAAGAANSTSPKLEGRAVLPAATFANGPVSGTLLGSAPINGIPVPFPSQPVQGFSGLLPAGDGSYWAMPDNGYGSIENSADFNLRVYLIKPSFETALGGSGTVKVQRFIQLHDPNHKVPFAIVHNWTRDRVLTGADFDIESIQRARDGTLWFGDEFGPFLLHTDETGKVLHAPYPLPDPDHPGQELRAAQNPFSEEVSTLRVMNALRGDAQAHGDTRTPIVSPDANLLADNDPTTFEPTRQSPPAGSGVKKASSEIISVSSLHAAGFKVVPYTVDDPVQMDKLIKLGVDGLITERPDLGAQVAKQDGLDLTRFDLEGHRGGRDLRPENTLPAMEAGLDNGVTTLETDNHLTKDGVPILSHDPYIDTGKCRRTNGRPYTFDDEILIEDLTLKQVQSQFICDGVIRTGTPQTNDRTLSPVAVAFAKQEGLIDPYVDPTTQQLFDFVKFYAQYYSTGAGRNAAGAGEAGDRRPRHADPDLRLRPQEPGLHEQALVLSVRPAGRVGPGLPDVRRQGRHDDRARQHPGRPVGLQGARADQVRQARQRGRQDRGRGPAADPRPRADLAARPAGRRRAREPVRVPVPDDRDAEPARSQDRPGHQRQQLPVQRRPPRRQREARRRRADRAQAPGAGDPEVTTHGSRT